jgi:hypothetical protein
MTRGFDPANGKFYKNIKEHITKQGKNGGLGDQTKKLIQDQMEAVRRQAQPRKDRKV